MPYLKKQIPWFYIVLIDKRTTEKQEWCPMLLHPRRPRGVSGDGEKSKTGEFFSPVLDFSPSPLTAPGSPRMMLLVSTTICQPDSVHVLLIKVKKKGERGLAINVAFLRARHAI